MLFQCLCGLEPFCHFTQADDEPILSGLDLTDLFVVFLSDRALDSPWVQREIREAYDRNRQNQIRQMFPIIIDEKVSYDDDRIPKWMREKYNVRRILSPKIAASKIKAHARELAWKDNPQSYGNQTFFLGRNSEIAEFEKRKANLDKADLKCVIASSGFKGIGRKSYIEQCFKKVHVMKSYYKYHLITLEGHESIEDFIIKIGDLGIKEVDIKNIVSCNLEEKINIAIDMVVHVQHHREFIFINDNGVIVKPNQEIAEWFERVIEGIENTIVFGIAANYYIRNYKSPESIFSIRIPELSVTDRTGMLIECCNMNNLDVEKAELKIISDNLTGYPEQIFYVVNMIAEDGLQYALNHLNEVRDYSFDKAYLVIEPFEKDTNAIEFLVFLSSFDFISMQMLDIVFSKDNLLEEYYYKFLALSICEFLGSDREYVKVNDVLKDYLFRQKLSMGENLKKLMKLLISYTVDDNFINNTDLATYYAVIKNNIENVDEKYIIPSHYLKCIVEAYNARDYKKVLRLGLALIERQAINSFDPEIVREIYYYICLALAREHDSRFFAYINLDFYDEADRKFLYGFYYRIAGNFVKSIENLKDAINLRPSFPRARRELVNAYVMAEDYENASLYSKENYLSDQTNPYHIQSYFKTLINLPLDEEKVSELQNLIADMKRIKSQVAKQMYTEMEAIFLARYENDDEQAIAILNNELKNNGNNIYLLLTKFDILEQKKDVDAMEQVLDEIEQQIVKRKYYSNAYYLRKAKCLITKGKSIAEVRQCLEKLRYMPERAKIRLYEKLNIELKI